VERVGRKADPLYSDDMKQKLRFMERMVNTVAEDSIYRDFKYYEDKSDEFRPNEGSLMPLWRFDTDRSKKKQVTALAWNPHYHDLFAVGYGSYDFMK
jgi:dynein intermediate chain 1